MSSSVRYAGMTLNERLSDAGLLDAFDAARASGDRKTLIALCREVDADDPEWIGDAALSSSPDGS